MQKCRLLLRAKSHLFICVQAHSGFVRHILTSFFLRPLPARLFVPPGSTVWNSPARIFCPELSALVWARVISYGRPGGAGSFRDRPSLQGYTIAQVTCQGNSCRSSCRQAKILPIALVISCRQEGRAYGPPMGNSRIALSPRPAPPRYGTLGFFHAQT